MSSHVSLFEAKRTLYFSKQPRLLATLKLTVNNKLNLNKLRNKLNCNELKNKLSYNLHFSGIEVILLSLKSSLTATRYLKSIW